MPQRKCWEPHEGCAQPHGQPFRYILRCEEENGSYGSDQYRTPLGMCVAWALRLALMPNNVDRRACQPRVWFVVSGCRIRDALRDLEHRMPVKVYNGSVVYALSVNNTKRGVYLACCPKDEHLCSHRQFHQNYRQIFGLAFESLSLLGTANEVVS